MQKLKTNNSPLKETIPQSHPPKKPPTTKLNKQYNKILKLWFLNVSHECVPFQVKQL